MEAGREAPDSIGLDELVESRLHELILSIRNGSAQDIEPELKSLAELIDAYGRKDELLANLLDPLTKSADRQQIHEALKSQHLTIARDHAELERLHIKSRNLLKHSIELLLIAHKQNYNRHNGNEFSPDGNEFSPELCGFCRGFGRSKHTRSPACEGRRFVLVHQPPIKCPRCKGNGKADPHDRVTFARELCLVCRGKGWALAAELELLIQS